MLLRVQYMISSTHPLLCTLSYHHFFSLLFLKLRLQRKCSDLKRSPSEKHLENNLCSVYSLRDEGEEEENRFPLTMISSGRLNQMTIIKTRTRGRWVVGVLVRTHPGDKTFCSALGQTAKAPFRILHILFALASICSHSE